MTTLPYKMLNRKSDHYDFEMLATRSCLYKGGRSIMSNVERFLPLDMNESSESYHYRLKKSYSCYMGYFSDIINTYASKLFQKQFHIDTDSTDEYYREFVENCDRGGKSLHAFMKLVFTNSLIYNTSFVCYDLPSVSDHASTKHDQELNGELDAYLAWIPNHQVITYITDDRDVPQLVIIKKERCSKVVKLEDDANIVHDNFSVWDMENGFARKREFTIAYKHTSPPSENAPVTCESEIVTSFTRIPIMCLDLPDASAVGQTIADPCIQHFARYSSLIHSQNDSLKAVKYFKQGAEKVEISKSQNLDRGQEAIDDMIEKNFAILGGEDEVGYLQPNGDCYSIVSTQLKELVDEIYRLAGLSQNAISSTSTAQGRTGESKAEDRKETTARLFDFSETVKTFITDILYGIASIRQDGDITFGVTGLDNFSDVALKDLAENQNNLAALDIGSPTWQKAWKEKVAKIAVPGLPPSVQKIINQEISDHVDANGHNMDAVIE